MKNLIIRALTGAVLLVVLIGSTIIGKLPLLILTTFLSLVGIYEFFIVSYKMNFNPNYILAAIFSIIILLISYFDYYKLESVTIILYTFISMGLLALLDYFDLKTMLIQVFAIIYIPLSFSRLILLSESNLIWLIYICSWGTDTFAYLVGSVFGKHRLSKKLSPKKSVEGAIGGIIGCGILTYIFAVYMGMDNRLLLVLIASIGSVFSQIGDLCASKFKRLSDTKDYGKIFLGHGGVLDRFDSVLFTTPYIYLVSLFI